MKPRDNNPLERTAFEVSGAATAAFDFESYRMLGAHAIARLGAGWTGRSLDELVRHAGAAPETPR